MGFMDAIGQVLGGFNAVKQIDTDGFDFREKRAAAQAARDQAAQQYEQQNEDYLAKSGSEAAIGGMPEQELGGMLPADLDPIRRKAAIARMVGQSAQAKSSLEDQKTYRDLVRQDRAGQQRIQQIDRTAEVRKPLQDDQQAAAMDRLEKTLSAREREGTLDREMARTLAEIRKSGGGGGGARKPYWNVKERRTDFLTNEEVGSVPQGTYTDVVTGRGQANSGDEGMNTIVQNLDDSLANYEQSQKGIGMLVPSSMNVAWDRYRSALQSAGQIFGRQFLKDTRVSEQDREAYSKTIGQPNRWLTVLDPREARRRLDLIKKMAQKYPGIGEAGGEGGQDAAPPRPPGVPAGATFDPVTRRWRL